MENASKALIIAGAILLAILIISLGLVIYNQAKSTVDKISLSDTEIQEFNSKFTAYEGNNVSGSKVNQLIQTVLTVDRNNAKDNTGNYVAIAFPTKTIAAGTKAVTITVDTSDATGQAKVVQRCTDITAKAEPEILASNGGAESTNSTQVSTGKQYTIKLKYDDASALVSEIKVKEN